jgi:hypothetical protein
MQSDDAEFPHWHGCARADGLRISPDPARAPTSAPTWRIVMPSGWTLYSCPCCEEALETAQTAKRVADAVYPVGGPVGGWFV